MNAPIRDKSKCPFCNNKKSRFMKRNRNKKVVSILINKHADFLLKNQKKYKEYRSKHAKN